MFWIFKTPNFINQNYHTDFRNTHFRPESPNLDKSRHFRPALIQFSRFWPKKSIIVIRIISITKKDGDINKF